MANLPGQNILKVYELSNFDEASTLFKEHFAIPQDVIESVKKIVYDVKVKKEIAALKYTNKFDKVNFRDINDAKVTADEIKSGFEYVTNNFKELIKAIKKSYKNILKFHEEQLKHEPKTWFFESENGKKLGQLMLPLERICVYIPGGRYVYPSSLLMTVIPAKVAGVKEIVVCTPPQSDGEISNLLLYLFKFLDISEIYKIGGAQAVALMAFGGEKVRKVSKIVGPGNIYVTAAKKIVFGEVGIDSLAGPSEIVIIADENANPKFVGADLLSQAEHDPNSKSILLTNSRFIAEKTIEEISTQIDELKKEYPGKLNDEVIIESITHNCKIILCKDIKLAADISNYIAPEHLEIMTENAFETLKLIKNSGSIFLSNYTPVAVGDYIGGTNHVLPTNGTAVFSSPLGVYDFFKKSAVTFYSYEALKFEGKLIETFAETENLLAHKNSIRIRYKNKT